MKKIILVSLIVILLFSSCGFGQEIDTLGIVVGMAFDKGKKDIDMSVCFLKVNGEFGAQGEGGEPYAVVSASGNTIQKAKAELILEAERTPFFGHNNIIFIGKNAEIKKIMTELYSDMQTRGSETVVLCENKASDVFDAENFMGDISAVSIHDILKSSESSGSLPQINIHEIIKSMNMPSSCCLVPVGKTQNKEFSFLGMGILKDYEFYGVLSEKEAFGAFCLTESGVTATIENGKDVFTVELLSSSIDIKDGIYVIEISHKLKSGDEQAYLKYVKDCIYAAVKKAEETGCDFMGFADAYFRKYGEKKEITDINYKTEISL